MVAPDVLAEPWLLGIGPITAEVGSAGGAGLGADLQAATKAAAALAANANSQNRRGGLASNGTASPVKAGLGLSCLIVVGLEFSKVDIYFPAAQI